MLSLLTLFLKDDIVRVPIDVLNASILTLHTLNLVKQHFFLPHEFSVKLILCLS